MLQIMRHVRAVGLLLAAGTVAAVVLSGPTHADGSREEFDQRVREAILRNPEILIEAMKILDEKHGALAAEAKRTVLADQASAIFSNPDDPVGGNLDGDVTLVEFFDYNCPYCRKASPILSEAIQADRNLRVVYKEFPILGPGSTAAAKAALAAHRQGRYEDLHRELMAASAPVSDADVLRIVDRLGLEIDQLKADMSDPLIAGAIAANLKLAKDLGISGTPAFVVGDQVIHGLVSLERLQDAVRDVRAEDQAGR